MKSTILKCYYGLLYFLAVGFGSGLLPKAPGTWGSLIAIPLYVFLMIFVPEFYIPIVVGMTLIGLFICDVVANRLGGDDPSEIVWDEICGMLLVMCLQPMSLFSIVTGFLLFRLFDIWKPFPIRQSERVPHRGTAIMIDDVLAAGYAWCILSILPFVLSLI